MNNKSLFTQALGIKLPWEIKSIDFDESCKKLDINIDFPIIKTLSFTAITT